MVEIEGQQGLVKSCAALAEDGMKILTESAKVVDSRVKSLEKIQMRIQDIFGEVLAKNRNSQEYIDTLVERALNELAEVA